MTQTSNAPTCIVIGCNRLSALADITHGTFWTYHAYYCATCYQDLVNGRHPDVDPARLVLVPADAGGPEDIALTAPRDERSRGMSH